MPAVVLAALPSPSPSASGRKAKSWPCGEVPDREAALREIFDALKPGGILSVTEIILDPHFQSRPTVARLARSVGLREQAFHGNRVAFTLNLEKPHGSTTRST
jgi:cyanophycinase-like exopeptidase